MVPLGVAKVRILCQIHSKTCFSQYLGKGLPLPPRPKFCTMIVLQKGSAQAKKTEKIMHTMFVPSPTFFQIWGPLSLDRGQISACFQRRPIGGGVD